MDSEEKLGVPIFEVLLLSSLAIIGYTAVFEPLHLHDVVLALQFMALFGWIILLVIISTVLYSISVVSTWLTSMWKGDISRRAHLDKK